MMNRKRLSLLFAILLICTTILSACSVSVSDDTLPEATIQKVTPIVHKDIMYLSFEDAIKSCTNIIVGKYLGKAEDSCNGKKFEAVKQLKGSIDDAQICLHHTPSSISVVGTNISYISDPQYVVGDTYLLVLSRTVLVYQDHDSYQTIADIYIPLSDLTNAKMYSNEPFREHSALSIENETSRANLYSHITKQLSASDNSTVEFYGLDYIRSTNIVDVVIGSEHIMKVSIDQQTVANPLIDTITYRCTILSQYKGNVTTSFVDIMFNKGSVELGNKYIIATTKTSVNNLMHLSSKASIFSVDQEDLITSLIAENTLSS